MEPEHNDSSNELRRLSHDLKNALSAIYSYAQLLEFTLSKKHMTGEQRIAASICESAKKMDTMITDRIKDFNSRGTDA